MAPWDPLDAPLDPQGLPAPPIDPLGPLNRSLGLIELLSSPQLPQKSHSPSTPSPMSPRHTVTPVITVTAFTLRPRDLETLRP